MTHKLELMFAKERITKNTVRFVEVNEPAVVGTIYVQKTALKEFGNPDHLSVTIGDAFTRCSKCNKNIVDSPSDICPACTS